MTLSAPTSPSPHLASAPSSWWGILPEAPHAPAPSTSPLYYLFLPTGLLPKVPPTPPALFLRGSFPLAGPHPQVPPVPVAPSPRLTTTPPPPGRTPSPKRLPHQPFPASASLAPLPPGGAPTPRRLPHRFLPVSTSPPPPPPGGEHPKKFFPHRAPFSAVPTVKNRLGGMPFDASWPHPGVFGLFSGFSGYFLGFSGCFLKKVGPKTSLFPPLPV